MALANLSKPPLGARLDLTHPLAEGLVGCWLMNEAAGGLIQDLSPYKNHGILTNMDPSTDWVNGPHGAALDVIANNQRIVSKSSNVFVLKGNVSIVLSCLIRSTGGVLFTMEGGPGETEAENAIAWIDTLAGIDLRYIHEYGSGANETYTYNSNLATDKWYNIAIVRNSVSKNIMLYLNGSLLDTFSYTNQATTTATEIQVFLGSRNNSGFALSAIYDYLYIFPNVLIPDQVSQLYREPFAMIKAPGPARYFSIAAGGPFLLDVAGAMASSGSILNQPRRGWDGAMASSGLLIDKAGKIMTGSMSSSSLLSGESRKVLAGAMSSSGGLTILATRLVALAGSMVSAGAILLQPRKLFTGVMSGVGTLTKKPEKVLSGAMASSGAASHLITKVIALFGSMASAGALLLRPGKVISGTMSGAGALVKSLNKTLSGTMASSGDVKKELRLIFNGIMASSGNALKQAGKLFSGAMGSSGIAVLSLTRILTIAGSMVSSGILQKSISKLLDSSMTSSGILSKSISKILVGILTSTGIAILQVTGRAIQIFYQLDVEAQDRIDNVEIQERIVTVEAQKRIDTILK